MRKQAMPSPITFLAQALCHNIPPRDHIIWRDCNKLAGRVKAARGRACQSSTALQCDMRHADRAAMDGVGLAGDAGAMVTM